MNALGPIAALLAGSLLALPATAQSTVTRSQNAASGKATRLLIAPNLKKDCSNGPMPEFKITTAPKNGSVISRSGKLKTPASYRCPNKEAEAQALYYESKPGFTGTDEVLVEIKTSEGTIERQDIRITVDASKKEDSKGKDAKDKSVTDL